jgi:hypothetical protein
MPNGMREEVPDLRGGSICFIAHTVIKKGKGIMQTIIFIPGVPGLAGYVLLIGVSIWGAAGNKGEE